MRTLCPSPNRRSPCPSATTSTRVSCARHRLFYLLAAERVGRCCASRTRRRTPSPRRCTRRDAPPLHTSQTVATEGRAGRALLAWQRGGWRAIGSFREGLPRFFPPRLGSAATGDRPGPLATWASGEIALLRRAPGPLRCRLCGRPTAAGSLRGPRPRHAHAPP